MRRCRSIFGRRRATLVQSPLRGGWPASAGCGLAGPESRNREQSVRRGVLRCGGRRGGRAGGVPRHATVEARWAGASFSPSPSTSTQPAPAGNRAVACGVQRRVKQGRPGCGRLPYRHAARMPSHRLRGRGANPLPRRVLPPVGIAGFLNEFSAPRGRRDITAAIPAGCRALPEPRDAGAHAHTRPAQGNDREIRGERRCRDNFLSWRGSCA